MGTLFVTGANRGLGLEFVRQYLENSWEVYATCRKFSEAKDLQALEKKHRGLLHVYELDLLHFDQIDDLSEKLKDVSIDLLINNAGVYLGKGQSLDSFDYEDWGKIMRINVFAPMKVSAAFLSQLEQGQEKCLVHISSKMGSISDNSTGGSYLYRSSKAALNAAVKSLSFDLKRKGITTIVLHPGWVLTDMGGSSALIDPKTSILGMRSVIASLDPSSSGKFFDYRGEEIAY